MCYVKQPRLVSSLNCISNQIRSISPLIIAVITMIGAFTHRRSWGTKRSQWEEISAREVPCSSARCHLSCWSTSTSPRQTCSSSNTAAKRIRRQHWTLRPTEGKFWLFPFLYVYPIHFDSFIWLRWLELSKQFTHTDFMRFRPSFYFILTWFNQFWSTYLI